jgi:hypothetical protein
LQLLDRLFITARPKKNPSVTRSLQGGERVQLDRFYNSPMPPLPIVERTSYSPSFVPGDSGIRLILLSGSARCGPVGAKW